MKKKIDNILRKFYGHVVGIDDYGCKGCEKFVDQIYDLHKKELEEHGLAIAIGLARKKGFIPKPELLVPDSIRIETVPYWKGIQFGNKQVLGMRPDGDSYRVERKEDCYVKPHKLIPCEYKELKVGDLAFRTDHKKTDFTSKLHYCFILPKNE